MWRLIMAIAVVLVTVGGLIVHQRSLTAQTVSPVEEIDELLGWWKLDEDTGTVAVDSSGNGNDGEFVGEPAPVWRSSGDQVVALELRGGEGAVVMPVIPELTMLGEAVTVAVWLKRGARGDGTILDTWVEGETSGSVALSLSLGRPVFEVVIGGKSVAAVGAGELAEGVWQHVAGTYDGRQVRVLVDGAVAGAVDARGAIDSFEQAVVLGRSASGWPLVGELSDVRVYRRAVGTDEIAAIAGVPEREAAGEPVTTENTQTLRPAGGGKPGGADWVAGGSAR